MTTADLQLAERIERAAWWPGHTLREHWKLGDYSVYALTFPAPGFKALHVRFVSEPDAAAMLEVSASNDDPHFRTIAPDSLRAALTATGFWPGSGWYRALRFRFSTPMETERAESVIELMRRRRSRVEMTAIGDQLLLEQCVLVEGGVTEEHLRLQLRNWRGLVAAFSAICRRMEEDAEA